jgi:hypothetical protein
VYQETLGNFTIVGTPQYVFSDVTAKTLNFYVKLTPPGVIGSLIGAHFFAIAPDPAANPARLGVTPLGTAPLSGPLVYMDLGKYPYVASNPYMVVSWTFNGAMPANIRLYVAPYSNDFDPGVQSGTPSVLVTLTAFTAIKPGSATNVTSFLVTSITPLTDSNYTNGVAPEVSVGGQMHTPIAVQVSLSALPTPLPDNFRYQLVGYENGDLTTPQVLASGYYTIPLPVPGSNPPDYGAGPDGISLYHTFGNVTPTKQITATIFAVSGLMIAPTRNVGGILKPIGDSAFYANNIVPGVTPSCEVTYGSPTGETLTLSNAVLSSLNSTMTVLNGLFGTAPSGITNEFLAALAVSTTNIQDAAVATSKIANFAVVTSTLANAAVDTTKLAALAVQAANIANQAVGTAEIANGAVGTAQIANAAITNALIANAAVGTAAIAALAVGTAAIATAAITTAKIANLAITNALIANAAIGTAQIQNLAVTNALIANLAVDDSKIQSLSVSKLLAGTITVAVSLTAPTITVSGGTFIINLDATNAFKCTGSGVTTTINNAADPGGNISGLAVKDSSNNQSTIHPLGFAAYNGSGQALAQAFISGSAGIVVAFDSSANSARLTVLSGVPSVVMNGFQVVKTRQGDPGIPSFASLSDVQTWCTNLRNSLAAATGGHGLF